VGAAVVVVVAGTAVVLVVAGGVVVVAMDRPANRVVVGAATTVVKTGVVVAGTAVEVVSVPADGVRTCTGWPWPPPLVAVAAPIPNPRPTTAIPPAVAAATFCLIDHIGQRLLLRGTPAHSASYPASPNRVTTLW